MFKKLMILMFGAAFIVAGLSYYGGDHDQEKDKLYTIGYLNASSTTSGLIEVLQLEMTSLGYVEGENIAYLSETPDVLENLDHSAQALVDAQVDLIFAFGRVEAQAARAVTSDIPIVFGPSYAPVEAGLVDSMTRPGGNMTGIMIPDTTQQRLQFLIEAAPGTKAVLIPYDPTDAFSTNLLAETQAISLDLGVEIIPYVLSDLDTARQMFERLPDGIDALFLGSDRLTLSALPVWLEQALAHKIPASFGVGDTSFPTIFLGYGIHALPAMAQAARMIDQIIQGKSPSEVPVEVAEVYLVVNLAVADSIGITVPNAVLTKANVILRQLPASVSQEESSGS